MSQFFNPFEGANKGGGGGGGTSDYNELSNKPRINSVPLTGNKSLEDLGIVNTIVDSELSTTSENPVQNKVVTSAINEKLDIDDAVGKNTTGTEYTIDGQTVVAQAGAEIFNDYANNKAAGRYSHAEGEGSQALGVNSHAEGSGTQATGTQSHAEGVSTRATGAISHAEGSGTIASGVNSHTEGGGTIASGESSHAEGNGTTASGDYSHAEGSNTTASGQYSHVEGRHTIAAGVSQHVQGKFNVQDSNNKYAFIIGNGTSNVNRHNAFAVDWDGKVYVNGAANGVDVSKGAGKNVTGTEYTIDGQTVVAKDGAEIFNNYEYNQAAGLYSHAEGASTNAIGNFSHAEGANTVASGSNSHAEGAGTQATGAQSHAEGAGASATGDYSHAEGSGALASGRSSHAEGYGTASGNNSHAEGGGTASGDLSHAEGGGTTASNNSSHAEGYSTTASGVGSHAEGQGTVASGPMSHAEGYGTTASKYASHAEGSDTIASGTISHAEGNGTIASSDSQHAQGKYNIEDANGKYAFIIGNGTNSNNRSNAFAVDWDGKIYVNNSENGIDLNQLINDEDITGVPPLTVTLQKQQVVTQWEIQGNTEQDGTPTTSNPIPIYGVGDKTNNLCSELVDFVRINTYNGVEEYANDMKSTDFIPVDFVTNQYYTPSFIVPTGTTNDTYISGYDINKNYLGRTTGGITSGQPMEFQGSVDTSAVKYVRICANIQTQDVMFNVGNIPLLYEPYGYKISIVVNENTVIPFYLDSPLYEGDSASFADNGSSFVTRTNGVIASYNGETIGNDYVSSTGELSTGAFVVYKLNSPVTTQTTLPDFQLRSGINTIDIDTDVTPASLYVRWGASNIKTLQFAYISPNGDDTNEGSSASSPFATINHALDLGCSRIFLAGGKYAQTVDLSKAKGKHIQIESLTRDSRPVFVDPDCVLVESATLENGVYHATISATISSGNAWIYQDDIPDLETTIPNNERMPLQRGKSERCEDTKIERCSSDNLQDALSEITSASTNIYKWYLDGTTLYFSAPNAPSEQNPICYSPGNGLFSNGDRSISLTINGIKCKYISLNVENLCDVSLTDCQVSNIFGWGAIGYSNTLNAKFLRCEASRCYNNGNGDGFNADVSNTGEPFAKHYSATLIDCWSHDNCDDGYSNHRHAESTIIGGLFEYNGKAGITPSYGEHCSCYNVYSRHNYSGFLCAGEVEQAEGGKYTQLICNNCIAESNDRGGHYAGFVVKDNGNRMILIDCKSINNTNAYYIGQTANANMTDCTAIGQTTLIDGYPNNATVETTTVGRNVTGTTYTIENQDVVAKAGAEIFNTGKFIDGGQEFNNVNTATGLCSHAEGIMTTASGDITHAEGNKTTASGWASHAEGEGTVASGNWSHAKGYKTIASGAVSYAEGYYTQATGLYSHAEGDYTESTATNSHAEGYYSQTTAPNSHAEGKFTIAAGENQHVQGKYNIAQGDLNTQMAFIIGNGTSDQNRSNAFAVDWDGKIYQGNTNNGVNLADQQKEIDYAINTGVKNLLRITSQSQTISGVTFTVNDDQTITVNGTNTGTSTALFVINDISLPSGIAYTLSGCPSGGSTATYYLGSLDTANWQEFTVDTGNGNTATLDEPKTIRFRIGIRSGVTVDNLVFKPMLRHAEITDGTFKPYAPTNRELYETKVSQKEALTAKTTLENAIDLDDIKTAGIYHGVNSAGWNATHMPVANGGFNFSLMVIESGEFIIQIFKQLNGAGDANIYIRRFYIWNTGWDSWYQFTGVPV